MQKRNSGMDNRNGEHHHAPLDRRGLLAAGLATAAVLAYADVGAQAAQSGPSGGAISSSTSTGRRRFETLEVSAIGCGCMNFVQAYARRPSKQDAIRIIRAAYEHGVTFFDVAQSYGPFTAEDLVGEALAPFRHQVVIATKFGHEFTATREWKQLNGRPEYIRQMTEESLPRLKTGYIDLHYQHRVDPKVPMASSARGAYGMEETADGSGARVCRRFHASSRTTRVAGTK